MKNAFLKSLVLGENRFIIYTILGSAKFILNVLNTIPVLSGSAVADFDKAKTELVCFNIDAKGLTGTLKLVTEEVSSKNYTFSGNVLTIKADYLSTLEIGENKFVFTTSSGSIDLTFVYCKRLQK